MKKPLKFDPESDFPKKVRILIKFDGKNYCVVDTKLIVVTV